MLLNCDFERHEFELRDEKCEWDKWYIKFPGKYSLLIKKCRKGIQKVQLTIDGKYSEHEFMYSPEQLRLFLIKNGIIVQNIIQNVRKNDT